MITYIRDDLPLYHRRKLEPESVKSICLDVMDGLEENPLHYMCVSYRSPRFCKVPDFISSLTSAAELIYKSRNELLLIGNFNMDIHTNDDEDITADKSLSDFCDRFCFTNQISEPTHVTENSKTLIDVVLTSHPELAIMTLFM